MRLAPFYVLTLFVSCHSNTGSDGGETCATTQVCLGAHPRDDGSCDIIPEPAATPCDDGDETTTDDRCDGHGRCAGYVPIEDIATLPYTRTDPLDIDREEDCDSYELYLPASIQDNLVEPLNVIAEGPVAFVWGNEYDGLPSERQAALADLKTNETLRQNARESLRELRRITTEHHGIETISNVSRVDGRCYLTALLMVGTGIVPNQQDSGSGGGTHCDRDGEKKIPRISVSSNELMRFAQPEVEVTGTVLHEYLHTIQCAQDRGEPTGWGWTIESFAQFFSQDIEASGWVLDQYRETSFWSIDAFLHRYGAYPFWMQAAEAFGYDFTADLIDRRVQDDEEALFFVRRIAPFDCPSQDDGCRAEAFANFYGDYAKNQVNFAWYTRKYGNDFRQAALRNTESGESRFSAYLVEVEESRYRIADWLAPQRLAHNIIELIRDRSSNILEITFDGWPVAQRGAQWRVTVVATLDGEVSPPREAMSPTMKSGSLIIDLAEWESDLGSSIEQLHVVVAATPTQWIADRDLPNFGAPERYRREERYTYEVTIRGAWPRGHEPMSERTEGLLGSPHSNGGGFVSNLAVVDASAYVGPNAMVLESAGVKGNARIEGRAVVRGNAVVDDHAIVSSTAVVAGEAHVSGYATIRDNARILDQAVVEDEGKLQGDASISGTFRVSDQAVVLGVPLIENMKLSHFAGMAVTDGQRWLEGSQSPTGGTPYDEWSPDDGGLFIRYDFEEQHSYRIKDVHGSSDAYNLDRFGRVGPAPILVDDESLGSRVIEFDGQSVVELPRWLLDRRQYRIEWYMRWHNSSGDSQTLLQAVTDLGEELLVEVRPEGDAFGLVMTLTSRDGEMANVLLSSEGQSASTWIKVELVHDAIADTLTLQTSNVEGIPLASQSAVSTLSTRDFDYDSLTVRLGARLDGTRAFSGRIDNFSLIRLAN